MQARAKNVCGRYQDHRDMTSSCDIHTVSYILHWNTDPCRNAPCI